MRLFVALELPEAVREALASFRDAGDRDVWRPVSTDAIHITLAFLGQREESVVPVISEALLDAASPAPRLAVAGALLLPPRRPRVLCASISDPDGVLAALQARVSEALAAAGVYEPEKRPFRAHATVARLRSGARPPRSVAVSPEPLAFAGGPLTLFESRTHPHGARYEPLVQVPLD